MITVNPDKYTQVTVPLQEGVLQHYVNATPEQERLVLYELETGTILENLLSIVNTKESKCELVCVHTSETSVDLLFYKKSIWYTLFKLLNKIQEKITRC